MVNFKINTRSLNSDIPLIELEGEVDVYTAPQLKQQMISLLESGKTQMVVDLTNVEYLDSTALGVLSTNGPRLWPMAREGDWRRLGPRRG